MKSTIVIELIPYEEIAKLPIERKVFRILRQIKKDKIVLVQGKLSKKEEAELIKRTMEEVNLKFKGIELLVVEDSKNAPKGLWETLKKGLINLFLGNRTGFTLIGPANLIKEIKRDPDRIQLFMDLKGK